MTATRTSSKNINSRYCINFGSISTFLIRQGCGSSSRMTLVGAPLNLGEKRKISLKVLTSFIKPQIWQFHVVVSQMMAKNVAGSAKLLFLPPPLPTCDVLVAVNVVVS